MSNASMPRKGGPEDCLSISVVVTTKDRGDMACRTVRSILQNRYPRFDVLLVDQSAGDEVAFGADEFQDDPRFRYVRTATAGISAARNVGAGLAQGEIVANTDDDCEVPLDWLERIAATFAAWPDAAVVFGEVDAAPHPDEGFIPAYRVRRSIRVRGAWRKHQIEGIGACFAYRRELWHAVGGFDERLGVGGEFRSAEEVDFTIRALALGRVAGETTSFGVVHFGFRRWDQAEDLLEAHLHGLGAMSAKHLKRRPLQYGFVLANLGARWFWGRPVVDFGHRPRRRTRLRAFLQGFHSGWRLPVDMNDAFYSSGEKTGAAAAVISRAERPLKSKAAAAGGSQRN